MIQTFTYFGIPKAQGRPKFFRRGNFTGAYDPKDSREYKSNVACQILEQKPLLIDREKAVELTLTFYLPRPKGHFNSKGLISDRYSKAEHTKKPDIDNLEKAIMDSLKGIVWHDDSQICSKVSSKEYGDRGMVSIRVQHE
jgi:Holliday junction resolvase RusA-like endonuclease